MEQNLHIDMDIKEVSKLAFERIMKQKRIFFSSQECIDYLKALPNRKGNILLTLIRAFWNEVLALTEEMRRPEYIYDWSYVEEVLHLLKEQDVDITYRDYPGGGITTYFNFKNVSVYMYQSMDSDKYYILYNALCNPQSRLSPVELVDFMFILDGYMEEFLSAVEEFELSSQKILKSNDILLFAAESIIKKVDLPDGVSVKVSIDCKGRILCIITKQDSPPYHKTCRSDLMGLLHAVEKTVRKVTAYRFTGYIDD